MSSIRTSVAFWLCMTSFAGAASAADAVRVDEGRQPQVAFTSKGVYVTYAKGMGVYCARSTDAGKTFGTPVAVAMPKNMSVGMRRGPRIAATQEAIVITAISGEQGGGKDGDLVGWRSGDGGRSWTAIAKPINTVAGAAREGLHGMAASPTGEVFCVWLDLRNAAGGGGTEVWGARSSDGGESWSEDFVVYRSPEKTVCECCHPSVAYGADGESLAVMFRNALGGRRDMYLVQSRDGGRTFGNAQKLGTGTWELNACPMDGGMAAFRPSMGLGADAGQPVTVWRRDDRVFAAVPGEAERELGVGMQPWVAAGPNGTATVWVSARPGALVLARGAKRPVKLADQASDPVIAAGAEGFVLAWEAGGEVVAHVVREPQRARAELRRKH